MIAYIQDVEGRTKKLQPFIDDAEAGKLVILIPEVCVTELLTLRGQLAGGDHAAALREAYLEFLREPYVVRVPVHADLAEEAGAIASAAPTKITGAPDAILIALAASSRAVMHTYDGESKAGPLKLDGQIGTPPIRICKPDYGQDTLFASND